MTTSDPAVRSVRIAVALCDRFAEILKGPSKVVAHKHRNALIGIGGAQEAMSLRIGEAQQIYPEIWSHLDQARAAFAGRGVDVSAYDQIRATEGTALGAAVETARESYGAGNYAYDDYIKSANFNREGHARARAACDALMRATPDIPWAEIARADAEDPNIAAFTRATRTKRWIRLALLVAVIAAPFAYLLHVCSEREAKNAEHRAIEREGPRFTGEEGAQLSAAFGKLREQLAAARRAWPTAVAPEALAAAAPGTAPCEGAFQAPTAETAASFVETGAVDAGFGPRTLDMYRPGRAIPDERLAARATSLEGLSQRAAAGEAGRSDLSRLGDLAGYVVFVVVDRLVQPRGPDAPGELAGHAYAFSLATQRLACAGPIDVKGAADDPSLARVRGRPAPELVARTFEVRIRQAIADGLRALR